MANLDYLDETTVPFPNFMARVNNFYCFTVVNIGILACVWLLATNLFRTHSASTKLLLSTIIADFILLVASLVYGIFNQIAGGYSFGKLGCLVSYYCVVTPACVSITTLGVVAWERYQIVCKGNQWSDTKITAWIIAIWGFFGLLLAIPMITSNYVSIRLEPNSMNCNVKWYDWSPQSLVMTVMIMTLSGIAYSVVFYSYYNVYMTYSAVTKKKKTNQDNQRIIFKKCVAMTLCLIVLWSTYYLKMFYEFVSGKSTNADWTSIANMSGILCSILNPIIMCMYDNRVRGNMLAVFEVFRKVPARVSVGSNNANRPLRSVHTAVL